MKLWILSLSLGLTSCAYTWGHENRSLPGGHKTVFVEVFKNLTKEVGAEMSFTQALNAQLERSGFVTVTSKERAEIVIEGTVLAVTHTGAASDPSFKSIDFNNKTSTPYSASLFTIYNLSAFTNIKAIRSRDGQTIWQTTLNGEKSYQGSRLKKQGIRSSNVLYNQSRRKQTMKLLAQDLMGVAFDRLTENF